LDKEDAGGPDEVSIHKYVISNAYFDPPVDEKNDLLQVVGTIKLRGGRIPRFSSTPLESELFNLINNRDEKSVAKSQRPCTSVIEDLHFDDFTISHLTAEDDDDANIRMYEFDEQTIEFSIVPIITGLENNKLNDHNSYSHRLHCPKIENHWSKTDRTVEIFLKKHKYSNQVF
jgi:hypothetical protein